MDKQERLYRLNKALNNLYEYTTLTNEERFLRVIEEIIKILEDLIEESEK